MARFHLFEFSDQPWFPKLFRDLFTDYLSKLFATFRVYESIVPILQQAADRAKTERILDLCSGASGPWLRLLGPLNSQGRRISVTLTDKYPNRESFRRISEITGGEINALDLPVDPTESVPGQYRVHTLFSSFHHFPPEQCRAILRNAAKSRTVICIFEMTQRKLSAMVVTLLLGPLALLCLTPFIRPLKLSRLFWTYVIPVIPLVYTWDGIVSQLRTYSAAELKDLAASVSADEYCWEFGRTASSASHPFPVQYLLGYPAACEPSSILPDSLRQPGPPPQSSAL